MLPPFPDAFRFGVATADHQCESYDPALEDIRDVWDRTLQLQQRGRATDFQNRFPEDVGLAQSLGCKVFRFSVSWTKVEPNPGEYSQDALAYYRRLAECIQVAGMDPLVTLLHFTWPVHLEQRGGLLSADFPEVFARYAAAVVEELGPLVRDWISFNEPNGLTFGYVKPWWERNYGFPPGLPQSTPASEQIRAVGKLIRNLFLAHTAARSAIRQRFPHARVGANPSLLGFPIWLQKLVDRNATSLKGPDDLARQASRYAKRGLLSSGKVDAAVATMTITPERSARVHFSEAYFLAAQALLVPAQSPVAGPADLAGKPVAVVGHSTAQSSVLTICPRSDVRVVKDLAAGLAEMDAGSSAALLSDDVLLHDALARSPGKYRIAAGDLTHEPYAVAVALGSPELLNAVDAAVQDFKSSGEWRASFARHFPGVPVPEPPHVAARRSIGHLENALPESPAAAPGPSPSGPPGSSLRRIQDRGYIRIGVKHNVPGLAERDPHSGKWAGLEVDLGRAIARSLFGDPAKVEFHRIETRQRIPWLRGPLGFLDPVLKTASILTTVLTTNWWHLGMAGRLPAFLCPPECRGQQDFIGFDYYWGAHTLGLRHISAFVEAVTKGRYDLAPVWPEGLFHQLRFHSELFPDHPIIIVENGCVDVASGISRVDYLVNHIRQVQRALAGGTKVESHLVWSITSNIEWGLVPAPGSDFGLYHIDLLGDAELRRLPTPAAAKYREIIQKRSADLE